MPIEIVPTERFLTDEFLNTKSHQAMNACHAHFTSTQFEQGVAYIFMAPDAIWADGSLQHIVDVLPDYDLLFGAAPRIDSTYFPQNLDSRFPLIAGVRTIPPRGLVSVAVPQLHPEPRSLLWEREETNPHCVFLLSEVPENGIVGRVFHAAPYVVKPLRSGGPSGTYDYEYAFGANPRGRVYYFQDSDDFCVFEVSSPTYGCISVEPRGKTTSDYLRFARAATNATHHKLFTYQNRWHAKEMDGEWYRKELALDRVADEVLTAIETSQRESPSSPASAPRIVVVVDSKGSAEEGINCFRHLLSQEILPTTILWRRSLPLDPRFLAHIESYVQSGFIKICESSDSLLTLALKEQESCPYQFLCIIDDATLLHQDFFSVGTTEVGALTRPPLFVSGFTSQARMPLQEWTADNDLPLQKPERAVWLPADIAKELLKVGLAEFFIEPSTCLLRSDAIPMIASLGELNDAEAQVVLPLALALSQGLVFNRRCLAGRLSASVASTCARTKALGLAPWRIAHFLSQSSILAAMPSHEFVRIRPEINQDLSPQFASFLMESLPYVMQKQTPALNNDEIFVRFAESFQDPEPTSLLFFSAELIHRNYQTAWAYLGMAQASLRLGQIPLVRKNIAAAEQHSAGNPDVLNGAAMILLKSGEVEPGLRRFHELIEKFPNHSGIRTNITGVLSSFDWGAVQEIPAWLSDLRSRAFQS
jgi:hypothetical protein